MADATVGARDLDTRKSLSWTELLKTFLIALDPFKLLVAAFGIFFTACGWWLISVIFFNSWSAPKPAEGEIVARANALKQSGTDEQKAKDQATAEYETEVRRYLLMAKMASANGKFRTMPWLEDRGPNHFLLTNEVIRGGSAERKEVLNWFASNQVPVLVEPLLKFLYPIIVLFDADANFWVRFYLIVLILWMLLVWGFVAGVITRMAVVQIAGKEGGGLRDSIRFVMSRYVSYVFSPLLPLLLILAVVVGCMFFGIFHMIPMFGDIVVDGFFWWIPLAAGFVIALLVVGLVGYPLMYATLSAEGSDTFDALSRSYNYVYESPWSYIWYSIVAVVYGAIVIFFVVFMTSLMVYFGKWGVSQTPMPSGRQPDYLFVYSPTSFGWRELMLKGSPVAITTDQDKVKDIARLRAENAALSSPTDKYYYVDGPAAEAYMKDYAWYNHAGAAMVGFWMTLLFMLMLGFSYSYFWSAAAMIYLLMRKKVDETEIDEIAMEEEEFEEPVAAPRLSPAPAPAQTPVSVPVEAPTLRVQPPPPPVITPPAPPAETPPPPLPPVSETPPSNGTPPTPGSSDGPLGTGS